MLHNEVFVDDGDALFVRQGVSSRKFGPNGEVTGWKETFSAVNEGLPGVPRPLSVRIGTQWVVRESLWNASCASPQRQSTAPTAVG